MKTQGEMEAAVCKGMAAFEQEYMGRGPKDIRAHLVGDILLVRLQGVLTAAEQHLVKTLPAEKGRDLLKQVRTQLMETARPVLEAMVQESPDREVPSVEVGEYLMERLRELDKVAFVRFASVYRDFQDVDQFMATLKGLLETSKE